MICLLLALICLLGFGLAAIIGAPYVPAFKRDAEGLIASLGPGKGKKFVDLGSGDGKILLIAAKNDYLVTGYEINPLLWLVSIMRTWRYRDQVKVRFGSYWQVDLSSADVIYVFLIERYMAKLEQKLTGKHKKGQVLISYIFALPQKKPFQTTRNAFFYQF